MSKVVVFLLTDTFRALLARRRREDSEWGEPYHYGGAGHVEPGETPEQAALREIQEEFGVVPTYLRLLGTRGDATDFLATVNPSKVRNVATDEHDQIAWFSLSQPHAFPTPWHPRFAEFLNSYPDVFRYSQTPLRPAPVLSR